MVVARPRCRLRGRVPAPCRRHGHHGGHHQSIKSLAKSVCGETDRIKPARMSGPRNRPRRAASATSPDRVSRLLSWDANRSRLEERRADDTTRSDADGRARGRVSGSWWITSSLRTTCSLTVTVHRRLDCDVRLRICAKRRRVGVPRRFKENRVRHGIRSRGIAGVPRRFWRRTSARAGQPR